MKHFYLQQHQNKLINKTLRNKSMKERQDLYIENYQTSIKEIKEDLNKWKDIHINGTLNIVKMVCVCVCVYLVAQLYLTLCNGLQPARLLCPWNFPGKNTGVVSHSLLQRISPIQRSKPGLLHYRKIVLPSEPQGSPIQNVRLLSLCAGGTLCHVHPHPHYVALVGLQAFLYPAKERVSWEYIV